jgi:hypothetical protein
VIIVSDSELYDSIVQSIKEFDFSNYGLDEVDATKNEESVPDWARGSEDWVYALASNIERDWVNYVDGITGD